MTDYLLDLQEISRKNHTQVGGKAANLGELIQNNFPVPKGFVITTASYRLFLSENDIESKITSLLQQIDYSNPKSVNICSHQIQKMITHSSIPKSIADLIFDKIQSLGFVEVAIRSSATAEDLQIASFAGQQESYLNIRGNDQILSKIKACYASLWSSKAIAYREKNNISHENVWLAAIVQQMIPAKSAGVMFTANPITLEPNEILIESIFGIGEALVSGQTNPDQFVVRYEKINKKIHFDILSREIGNKEELLITNGDGLLTKKTDIMKAKSPSLDDDQIIKLSEIGFEIEKIYKFPQDIEWAIDESGVVHILQSRPITSLVTISKESDIIWTRGYADDYWNDPTTPLFFSLLGNQLTLIVNNELNSIMGYPAIDRKLLHLSHGHVYFNLDVLKRKVEYEIPTFLRNEDVLNYFPEGFGPYGKETMKKLPFQLSKRIIAELRIMLHDNENGSILNTSKSYTQWTQDIFNPFCDEFDIQLSALKADKTTSASDYFLLADNLAHTMVSHFRLVRYGIPVHTLGMNLMAQYLLKRFIGENKAKKLYPILISGLKHKVSETNEFIHLLASNIRKSTYLNDLIQSTPSSELLETIKQNRFDDSVENFNQLFDEFLDSYGDRGFTREAYYPRWKEAPEYVFDLLKSLTMDTERKIETEYNDKRVRTSSYVEFKIRKQKFGLLKFKFFSIILNLAKNYIIFRENQRFNLDRWITRDRALYLEIGKNLANNGLINNPNEIFFLFKSEIRKLCHSYGYTEKEKQKISTLVKKRRLEFLKYEFTTPPKFLHGKREFDDPILETKENFYKGIPASQGFITGRIRVLKDIREISTVTAGDILVVPKTDPGWTPVFSKIGGLITETGGILSHGAVVSREYGIPAVTNITNACSIFQNGGKVTLDGNNGTIRIEK